MLLCFQRPGMNQSKPSLLGNPLIAQANAMLQGLFSQSQPSPPLRNNPTVPPPQSNNSFPFLSANLPDININMLKNVSQLLVMLQGAGNPGNGQQAAAAPQPPRPGLLGDAPMTHKPGLLGDRPGNPPKHGLLLGNNNNNNNKQPLLNVNGGPTSNAQPQSQQSQHLYNNGNTAPQPHNVNTQSKAGLQALSNLTPANPLLALFLENQIKQQLQMAKSQGIAPPGGGQKAPLLQHAPGQYRPPNSHMNSKPSKPLLPHPPPHQTYDQAPVRRGLLGDQPGAPQNGMSDQNRLPSEKGDDSDDSNSVCSNSGQFKTPLLSSANKRGLLGDKPSIPKAEVSVVPMEFNMVVKYSKLIVFYCLGKIQDDRFYRITVSDFFGRFNMVDSLCQLLTVYYV